MGWTYIQNSITADMNDIHANFKIIREGSLIPKKLSTSLSYTTGNYDIGSSTYRWNAIYVVNSITTNTITSSDNFLYSHHKNTQILQDITNTIIFTLTSEQATNWIELAGFIIKTTGAIFLANSAGTNYFTIINTTSVKYCLFNIRILNIGIRGMYYVFAGSINNTTSSFTPTINKTVYYFNQSLTSEIQIKTDGKFLTGTILKLYYVR